MYSKKLRRVVDLSEATRPPEADAASSMPAPPPALGADITLQHSSIFLKPKIARPIAQYPPTMVVRPTRLLSHHGFTPPRILPTPTPSPPVSNPIFLGPSGDVELSPVAAPAPASSTTFTIIVSNHPRPSPPLPDKPLPPPSLNVAIPTAMEVRSESDSQSVSEKPRKRRQRADDLVPAGCGLTREDIVCLPIDDFNDKVAEKSEKEIVVLKDRRRRGKNRVRQILIIRVDSFSKKLCNFGQALHGMACIVYAGTQNSHKKWGSRARTLSSRIASEFLTSTVRTVLEAKK